MSRRAARRMFRGKEIQKYGFTGIYTRTVSYSDLLKKLGLRIKISMR